MRVAERLDCVVIGAGVIGLAVARELALSGRQPVVLEAEPEIGMHTSSRNSEVIHAGIYYPAGSLKARLCVAGKVALYRYCEERGVPFRRTGKLIVACDDDELPILDDYRQRAVANGVTDLRKLSAADVSALEPEVRGRGGLLSPSTGIIDSHSLMLALQADLEAAGGIVVCRSRVTGLRRCEDGFVLDLDDDAGFSVSCATLVNAAGLGAAALAARMQGFPAERVPAVTFAKGHYFSMSGKVPFGRLVYPVAGGGGLGIHVTLDMAGGARFGPDVVWLDGPDYAFDDDRLAPFVEAIRRYYPTVEEDRLTPGYTGIRPKLSGPGEPAADFLIQGVGEHGVPGLVNLFGIESPGLTACLSIAGFVRRTIAAVS